MARRLFENEFWSSLGDSVTTESQAPLVTPEVKEQRNALYAAACNGDASTIKRRVREHGGEDFANSLAFQRAISALNLNAIRLFAESGINLDAADWSNRTYLDYAFEEYNATSNEMYVEVMATLIGRMNTIRSLQMLKQFVRRADFTPNNLKTMCSGLVLGSDFPIITALKVADLFTKLAVSRVSFAVELKALSREFTDTAKNLFNDIDSDNAAALILFQTDPMGHSVLSVALRTRNTWFVSDVRVVRVLNTIWSKPQSMTQTRFSSDPISYTDLIFIMVRQPRDFFLLPLGKFVMEGVSFTVFLLLYSYVVQQRLALQHEVTAIEWILWIFVVAFIVGEITEMTQGIVKYFKQGWNLLDVTIYSLFVVIAACRSLTKESERTGGTSKETVYHICVSLNVILLWVRVSYIFSIHPTVGPLLRMVQRMITDVKNFAVLMFLVMAGFALAFRFLVGVPSNASGTGNPYESLSVTTLTLFRAVMGDFSFDPFNDLEHATKVVAQVLFCIYLFIALIMLLNMLIAMMSETYSDVQDQATIEYLFGRGEIIASFDAKDNELPPPLNILVWVAYAFRRGYDLVKALACCRLCDPEGTREFLHGKNVQDGRDSIYHELDDDSEVIGRSRVSGRGSSNKPSDAKADEKLMMEEKTGMSDYSIPGYYCGYCHHRNGRIDPVDMRASIDHWLEQINLSKYSDHHDTHRDSAVDQRPHRKQSVVSLYGDEEGCSDLDKVAEEAVVCRRCFRVRKVVTSKAKRREDVSFVVFMVVLWPFLSLVLFVPHIISVYAGKLFAFLERKSIREEEERLQAAINSTQMRRLEDIRRMSRLSKDQAIKNSDDSAEFHDPFKNKAEWIAHHFPEAAPSLRDIYQRVEALHERLDALKKQKKQPVEPNEVAVSPVPSPRNDVQAEEKEVTFVPTEESSS